MQSGVNPQFQSFQKPTQGKDHNKKSNFHHTRIRKELTSDTFFRIKEKFKENLLQVPMEKFVSVFLFFFSIRTYKEVYKHTLKTAPIYLAA